MQLTLTVLNGPSQGLTFDVPPPGPFRIGSGEAVDVALPGDAAIAPAHAAVYLGAGGPRLRALLAGAPVWIDEREVTDAPLPDGARFCVGATWIAVAYQTPAQTPTPQTDSRTPKDRAADLLRAGAGALYAVLDAARDPAVISLLRQVSHPRRCLYDGWAKEVYGDVAPWIVSVPRGGALMERLLRDGWGNGWGVFVESERPMSLLRKHLRRLNQVELEGHGKALFRWYDPLVLDAMHPTLPHAWLHGESVAAFVVERGADAAAVRLTPAA